MATKPLEEFINIDDKYVASVATEIDSIYDDYINGRLDEELFRELVQDAIELAQVRREAQSLDTKIKLQKLIDVVKVLAKLF